MRFLASVVLAFGLAGCSARAATSCADLKSLSLDDATIAQAQPVVPGPFAVPAEPGAPAQSIMLPAFCRVQGVISPTRDSHIEFEVWLPAAGGNGKYQGVGNGCDPQISRTRSLRSGSLKPIFVVKTAQDRHCRNSPACWNRVAI